MSDDPGNLALVIGDPLAPGVLVWWRTRKATRAEYDDADLALCLRVTRLRARQAVHRCDIAGLLLDGGITPTAAKWLGALVAKSIGAKPGNKEK